METNGIVNVKSHQRKNLRTIYLAELPIAGISEDGKKQELKNNQHVNSEFNAGKQASILKENEFAR